MIQADKTRLITQSLKQFQVIAHAQHLECGNFYDLLLTTLVIRGIFKMTKVVILIPKGRRIIYTKFNNLKYKKKNTIINAGMKEFVQNGFDRASTNEIVMTANISKGSLFSYFNSKKDLYIYLIEYSVNIVEALIDQIDLNELDLFKRIEDIGVKKLYTQKKYPLVFDFLVASVQEESDEVKEGIRENVNSIYNHSSEKLYKNIDCSYFREDIDIEKAIEIINWTMSGFGEKSIPQIQTFENIEEFGKQYLDEWHDYSELLKRSFYK